MNLQSRTLERYRLFYPEDTLKETSARTGIQITRVFRLLNGKTMKVAELEAFEKAISEKLKLNKNFTRLTEVLEQASAILTNEECAKLIEKIERKNRSRSYGRFYVRAAASDAHSA